MSRNKKSKIRKREVVKKLNSKFEKGSTDALKRRDKMSIIPNSRYNKINFETMKSYPFYYYVEKENIVLAVLISLIKGKKFIASCNHILIGSSCILKLLSSAITPSIIHRYLITKEARLFGEIAEISFQQYVPKYDRACFASKKIPFICGTPDFIFNDRVIEIKSNDNYKFCTYNKEHLLQLVICLEILGLTEGELHYFVTKKTKTGYVTIRKIVIGIRKTGKLFEHKEFVRHSIIGYCNYLKIFFSEQSLAYCESDIRHLKNFLMNHVKNTKYGYIKLTDMKSTTMCITMSHDKISAGPMSTPRSGQMRWCQNDSRTSYIEDSFASDGSFHRCEKCGSRKNEHTCKQQSPFGKDIRCGELYSNYIESKKGVVTEFDYYGRKDYSHRFTESLTRNVSTIFNKEEIKKAIIIDDKELDKLMVYYGHVDDIGIPCNDFCFFPLDEKNAKKINYKGYYNERRLNVNILEDIPEKVTKMIDDDKDTLTKKQKQRLKKKAEEEERKLNLK